ncbi:hypothetical protein EVAR_93258_1 [Eumeta japonica]|uniref:Reverse transcriptase domain-containing protein n=1 Tax=Eumeta variegata TaxID=151549 RepID=A0A4C1TXV7_EUMVA|nr:hypothetical protein EVAR_93258_1 [Eumeta japonica]
MDEIMKALKCMKVGKAAGYDSFVKDAKGWWGVQWQACSISSLTNAGKAIMYLMTGVKQSLYPSIKGKAHGRGSSVYVRINGAYTDWFDIRKGVRQRCVASTWLFNLFMDSCLYYLKEYKCGLRMVDLLLKCFLYTDDQVILARSACRLQ